MSSDETSKPGAPDAKVVIDKIADAAPRADIRDIDVSPGSALDGLKKVDRTSLRLNKCAPPFSNMHVSQQM
jgi:hypothetical protein